MIIIVITILIFILMFIALRVLTRDNQKISAIVFLSIILLIFIDALLVSIKFTFLGILFWIYVIVSMYIGRKLYYKLKVKNIDIETKKDINDVRILYLSDFQFDKSVRRFNEKAMDNLVDFVNKQDEFDILLLGGDYINYPNFLEIFMEKFKKIQKPKYKAIGVLGNHDYVAYDEIIDRFSKIDVQIIDNDEELLKDFGINILGVSDEWMGTPVIKNPEEKNYNILLAHSPETIHRIDKENNFDLMLSGHYHAGQYNLAIIPTARLFTKYVKGTFYEKNLHLYVSSGIGGSFLRGHLGQYLRFNARPEIVFINLKKK